MRTLFSLLLLLFFSFHIYAQNDDLAPNFHIKSIFFGGGSYYIDDGQSLELRDFLEQFHPIEEHEIFIQSHTDNIGSMEYNLWLSNRRGEMTRLHILEHGIPPHILTNQDFGEVKPQFENDDFNGRSANRRVDVIIRRIVF
jgi:OOP family OmpA-OmpF porin